MRKTRVKKFAVFFAGLMRSWPGTKTGEQMAASPGIKTAMDLIWALQLICLSREPLGIGEKGKLNLPPPLRPMYKYFVAGWYENTVLMGAVSQSSRVECRFSWCAGQGINLEAFFYVKGRQELFRIKFSMDLVSGAVCGSGYSCANQLDSGL